MSHFDLDDVSGACAAVDMNFIAKHEFVLMINAMCSSLLDSTERENLIDVWDKRITGQRDGYAMFAAMHKVRAVCMHALCARPCARAACARCLSLQCSVPYITTHAAARAAVQVCAAMNLHCARAHSGRCAPAYTMYMQRPATPPSPLPSLLAAPRDTRCGDV